MIDINKKYCTVDGQPVRIVCVDRKGEACSYPVVGLVDTGEYEYVRSWTSEGKYSATQDAEHYLDLTEITEYDDIQIDQPVYVKNSLEDPWIIGHFAGIANGKTQFYPTTWVDGCTSHTSDVRVFWLYCLPLNS